ncbi:MAG: hypothetical protein K2P84_09195, partial [Undibacterium sp.]|nr:hypothetical protein [Undibacterium sp.]
MDYRQIFTWIVALVALELIFLAVISKRHVQALLLQGARIVDASGMGLLNILLRSAWIVSMLCEVWLLQRNFSLSFAIAAALVSVLALALRLASMHALGQRWTLPTTVVPGRPRVRTGIFAHIRHPNWLGVCMEIISIPMLHMAYISASVFFILEVLLLRTRIKIEVRALEQAEVPTAAAIAKPGEMPVCVIGAGAAGLA